MRVMGSTSRRVNTAASTADARMATSPPPTSSGSTWL